MKMVRAVVRPEKESAVASALAKANFPSLTKWDVLELRPKSTLT